MAFYSYNGTILPELPVSSGYQMITKYGEYVILYVSTEPFAVISNTYIAAPRNARLQYFLGGTQGSIWVDITNNQTQPDPEYSYTIFGYVSDFVWTNVDVIGLTSTGANAGVALEGTVPVWAAPDVPTIGHYGWTDGDGQYHITGLTIPVKKEGWSLTVDLRLSATVTDGGRMVVLWDKDGSTVYASESYSGSIQSVCKIDNAVPGTYRYSGSVWNIVDGVTRGKIGETITINVVDWNYDDYDPETGNNESGSFTPGTFLPDNQYPQTPVLNVLGEDATYRVGESAKPLTCSATVTDGGELNFAWCVGDTVVATGSTFTPPTDEVGVRDYYCVVANVLNGYAATEYSKPVTITVEAGFCKRSFGIGLATGLNLEGGIARK